MAKAIASGGEQATGLAQASAVVFCQGGAEAEVSEADRCVLVRLRGAGAGPARGGGWWDVSCAALT